MSLFSIQKCCACVAMLVIFIFIHTQTQTQTAINKSNNNNNNDTNISFMLNCAPSFLSNVQNKYEKKNAADRQNSDKIHLSIAKYKPQKLWCSNGQSVGLFSYPLNDPYYVECYTHFVWNWIWAKLGEKFQQKCIKSSFLTYFVCGDRHRMAEMFWPF